MPDSKEQKPAAAKSAVDTASDTKVSVEETGDGPDLVADEAVTAGRKRAMLEFGNTADNLSTITKANQSESAMPEGGASDPISMDPDEIKWERDVFRDVLSNVNQTLRFQIQLAVPLLAACVTVLNLVPPQAHQELLNELDRWVFIPVLISVGVAYRGLEFHWYSNTARTKLSQDIQELYQLVKYKHRMVKIAILLQALGLVLLMIFVLLEYK